MALTFLCITVFLCQVAPIFSAISLNCKVNNNYTKTFTDGELTITFVRDDLSLDAHNNTKLANFFLPNVKINYDGLLSQMNNPDNITSLSLRTNIEGSTRLETNKNVTLFTECSIDLKKFIEYSDKFSTAIQDKLIDLAYSCVPSKLCLALNHTLPDDYARAKKKEHDFKENSVLYRALNEKYPLMSLPDPKNKSTNGLQATINILADFWFANVANKLVSRQDGRISIPDVLESISGIPFISAGFFNMYYGSLGNIKDFLRKGDVNITNVGLEFSAEASYILPNIDIYFDKFGLKRGFIYSEGNFSIYVKDLKFDIKAVLNYNKKPCSPQITVSSTGTGQRSFKLNTDNFFDGVLNDSAADSIDAVINATIDFITISINKAVNEPLTDFNCENYRP